MEKTKYGIIDIKKPEFPQRALLRVPHKEGVLTLTYPAFGPDAYEGNLKTMSENYYHPRTGKRISFREPTTSESISAAAYDFKNIAKRDILDPKWLQTGYIVKTPEFVVANPPKDAQGNPIIDEQILKSYLNKSIKVNGIYLGENDFGVAPYETFEKEFQDVGKFAEGGLARILEHTLGKVAKNLKAISSSKNYLYGVNVRGFYDVKESVLRVASLISNWSFGRGFDIYGDDWNDCRGIAFGVLK